MTKGFEYFGGWHPDEVRRLNEEIAARHREANWLNSPDGQLETRRTLEAQLAAEPTGLWAPLIRDALAKA